MKRKLKFRLVLSANRLRFLSTQATCCYNKLESLRAARRAASAKSAAEGDAADRSEDIRAARGSDSRHHHPRFLDIALGTSINARFSPIAGRRSSLASARRYSSAAWCFSSRRTRCSSTLMQRVSNSSSFSLRPSSSSSLFNSSSRRAC
eukprot:IDg21807t1